MSSLIASAFFVVLFGLIVLVVIAGVGARRARRELAALARAGVCPRCSAPLNEGALEAADALWRQHMKTVFERNPGVRFRIVRTLVAVCSQCGARLGVNHEARTFHAIDLVLAFEHPPPSGATRMGAGSRIHDAR